MITYKDGKPYAKISLTQPAVPVVELHEDDMQCIIECPYCHQMTTVGESLMISGYVGCPNCYFVPGGLLETTLWYKENDNESYRTGEFYKKGFQSPSKNKEQTKEKLILNNLREELIKTKHGANAGQLSMMFINSDNIDRK